LDAIRLWRNCHRLTDGGIWLRAECLRGPLSLFGNKPVEIPILRAAEESELRFPRTCPTWPCNGLPGEVPPLTPRVALHLKRFLRTFGASETEQNFASVR